MYSSSYKRYITVLLLIVYIFHRSDNAIFGFLMEPIKRELALSDTQLGFLAGPAMVLFYATLGIPIARLADRSSRINIISIAIALWSGIVILSSAVGTFWQFALARIGVGIGEAGFSAIAQAVISDYHSSKERTRALSTFMLAMPVAAIVSSLMAGWINQVYGWRAAFVAAGVPGIILAVLVKTTVREPPRSLRSPVAAAADRPPLSAVFVTLWNTRALRHLAIAQGVVNVVANFMSWFPAFFMRVHGMSSGELGTWLAATSLMGGVSGIWLGGYLTSRYGSQDSRVKVRIMAIATALITPSALLALWCPAAQPALLLLVPLKFMLFFCYGPTFAFVQEISPVSMRATMASVFILIQVLTGGVIGIQLLGVVSDVLTPMLGSSAAALRWGMTLTCPLALWAALHFWLAGRSIRQDVVVESSGAEVSAKSTA